jgi:hypothetical protein
MIISEKQIFELMNIARLVCLEKEITSFFQQKVMYLINDIESQQSEELKTIE